MSDPIRCPGCVHEGPHAHDPSSDCPGGEPREAPRPEVLRAPIKWTHVSAEKSHGECECGAAWSFCTAPEAERIERVHANWCSACPATAAPREAPPAEGCGAVQCKGLCRSETPPLVCGACGKGTCATWFGIDGVARCWACETAADRPSWRPAAALRAEHLDHLCEWQDAFAAQRDRAEAAEALLAAARRERDEAREMLEEDERRLLIAKDRREAAEAVARRASADLQAEVSARRALREALKAVRRGGADPEALDCWCDPVWDDRPASGPPRYFHTLACRQAGAALAEESPRGR